MTDSTSTYAGGAVLGPVVTCILDEGAITVASRAYNALGTYETSYAFASELDEGDWVAISNDSAVLYDVCEGAPVVEKAVNTETLVIGRIVNTPTFKNKPASTGVADTLTKRLDDKYYRIANVEIMGGITGIQKATVMCDGTNATVPGVGSTLKFNITSGYAADGRLQFDSAASGGVGVIPFHNVPSGTDGDTYSCLVGITGLLLSVTGA